MVGDKNKKTTTKLSRNRGIPKTQRDLASTNKTLLGGGTFTQANLKSRLPKKQLKIETNRINLAYSQHRYPQNCQNLDKIGTDFTNFLHKKRLIGFIHKVFAFRK